MDGMREGPGKSGKCLHREEYQCTLTDKDKLIPGDGTDCTHSCCWECEKHGECRMECYSSANRPENGPEQQPAAVCEPEAPVSAWYEKLNLEDTESFIKSNLVSAAQNVIAIGYYLKHIRDGKLYEEAGYESIWDYASDRFGLSKSTTSRYISRNDKFSKGGNSPVLDSRYQDFGKAQLQEMLSLNPEQLEQVTPDMTVAQIREIRKPKEVPYYPLEGQMEITEFLEPEEPVQEPSEAPVSFQMDVSELTPEEPEEEAQEAPTMDHNTRRTYCNAFAKMQQIPSECCENSSEEELEEIATSQQDEPEEEREPTDIELLREMLEKENGYLEEMIKVNEVEPLPQKLLRKKKILVGALAGMLCDLDMPEPEEPEQPPLPLMRNNDQRKEWLRDYKSWGLWYEDEHIGCRYYKYDFDNGARLIAEVYDNYSPFAKMEYESSYLHLVRGPEPDEHPSGAYGRWSRHERYNRFPNSETELVEFLKSIQKGERK